MMCMHEYEVVVYECIYGVRGERLLKKLNVDDKRGWRVDKNTATCSPVTIYGKLVSVYQCRQYVL